jgi:hypothetical protein
VVGEVTDVDLLPNPSAFIAFSMASASANALAIAPTQAAAVMGPTTMSHFRTGPYRVTVAAIAGEGATIAAPPTRLAATAMCATERRTENFRMIVPFQRWEGSSRY